ncbi:MAG TPA: ribosome silencing factor [Bacteroidota bacterium]|nr:ribosome silencing factor [Bacteroidota bacterium]
MTSRTLAKKAAEFALSKKAYDIVVLDVRKLTSTADFFVICSADSDTQVRAVANAVEEGSDRIGAPVWHTEGQHASTWVILDYVDVVVHVFHREARSFYNLERLWGDAKITHIRDGEEEEVSEKKRTAPAARTHQRTSRVPKA